MKMITEKEEQRNWLKVYTVQDLSRSLVREFLLQLELTETLKTLDKQDKHVYKKISKSVLIRMLSMNNLIFFNKQSEKPLNTLVQVLVNYLRDKFKVNIELSGKVSNTSSNAFTKDNMLEQRDNSDYLDKSNKDQNSLINNAKVSQRNSLKEKPKRPVTTGSRISKNVQNVYAELQKQDAKLKEKQKMLKEEHIIQQQKKKQQQQLYATINKNKQKQKIQRQKHAQKDRQQAIKVREQQQEEEERKKFKLYEQRLKIEKLEDQRRQKQEEDIKKRQLQNNKRKQKQEDQRRKRQQEDQRRQKQDKQRLLLQIKRREQQKIIQQLVKQKQMKKFVQAEVVRTEMRKPTKKTQPQPQFILKNDVESVKNQVNNQIVFKKTESIEQFPDLEAAKKESKKQSQKEEKGPQEGPKLVKMFGKKKKNAQNSQQVQPQKFKFDDNFVDEPLHGMGEKYNYEPLQLNKIITKSPTKSQIRYKQKQFFQAGNKKYVQKQISQQQAQDLKKIVFQNASSNLPKSWHQGFILSPHANTPFGLQQIEGGPCGIIAAVQCYFLKHLLHLAGCSFDEISNETIRENCLVAAIADMLYKAKSNSSITLVLPPKSFSGLKLDISSFRVVTFEAQTVLQAFQGVHQYKSSFIGKSNHGVAVLMFCIVMTKGLSKIVQQIDMAENPLIGHHGHCTQELVNLFIAGVASSNVFDGDKNLDSLCLKGIPHKSQFGFLTIFETNNQIQVGKNLKNPEYPFWIICKQFHYHVIFASHYLIAENNNTPKFDIVYFDGLYNCADFIRITLEQYPYGQQMEMKTKDLPLIEQVMMTKWGARKGDWNGCIKIL